LAGFADYVLQKSPGNSAVQECIQEFQVAAARIKALAADFESLGQTDSTPEVVAIGDCVEQALADFPSFLPQIEWACRQNVQVRVDPWHARRAIASLMRIVMIAESTLYRDTVTVAQEGDAVPECAVCSASLRPEGNWVLIRASGVRGLDQRLLRDPFRADIGGRSSRRLAFAVLGCCAHRAGGHISLDQDALELTLSLPIR